MNRFYFTFTDGQTLEAGTVFGIGKNYAAHAREMGGEVPRSPMVFLKPPTALLADGGVVICPAFSENLHYEVEMVVVIGEDCQNVPDSEARSVIAGYAVGLDMTLRDVQNAAKQDGAPWAVAKGFVSSAPVSRVLPAVLFGEHDTIPDFDLELTVNETVRQRASTQMMERSVETLIAYLSSVFTLRRGDAIFTGTPEGVGQVQSGDVLQANMYAASEELRLRVSVA
jgi:acylpyruvate hydrolase